MLGKARTEEVGSTHEEARIAREESEQESSTGSVEPTQQADEAVGSVCEGGVRNNGGAGEEGGEMGVVDVEGRKEEGGVNAHGRGTRSTPTRGDKEGSEEDGATGGVRRQGRLASDQQEEVGESVDAPHTPRRSEEAEDHSDGEHEVRRQHTRSGSDDDSDAERTPVSRAQETEHLETVKRERKV